MSESVESAELPDVNVLVALTNPSHQHHQTAHAWLAEVSEFVTTPITESGLVRLLLNQAVTGQQVTGRHALGILSRVRAHPKATYLADDSSLAAAAVDLMGLSGHRQTTDAHLVNLAASHGVVLATFDRRVAQMLTAHDQEFVRVL